MRNQVTSAATELLRLAVCSSARVIVCFLSMHAKRAGRVTSAAGWLWSPSFFQYTANIFGRVNRQIRSAPQIRSPSLSFQQPELVVLGGVENFELLRDDQVDVHRPLYICSAVPNIHRYRRRGVFPDIEDP